MYAVTTPIATAASDRGTTRKVVVKSPSERSRSFSCCSQAS